MYRKLIARVCVCVVVYVYALTARYIWKELFLIWIDRYSIHKITV